MVPLSIPSPLGTSGGCRQQTQSGTLGPTSPFTGHRQVMMLMVTALAWGSWSSPRTRAHHGCRVQNQSQEGQKRLPLFSSTLSFPWGPSVVT